MTNFRDTANFIWSVADLLRGDYRPADYGKVILPFTVLRRLDSLLEKTKPQVLTAYPKLKGQSEQVVDLALNKLTRLKFHNHSKYDFKSLIADPNNIAANIRNYISGFSKSVRDIIDHFNFDDQIERLDKANLLFLVTKRYESIDLKNVDSMRMGYIFEELIRKFAEASNETAGDHFTPREVIRLMVDLLFIMDSEILTKKGIIKTMYDECSGTGGILSIAEEYVKELNPGAELRLFGQEINPESYAICKSDMLIKGQDPSNIKFGNTLSQDGLSDEKFDYCATNPPFGVDWKKAEKAIKDEYEKRGFSGRFGAGLPRINDGSLLFLQHMISKFKPVNLGGSRAAIILNGSPLFTGGAGSGESEIRKWIIENDLLEAIVALPDQLFYNTGISTYIWVLTNRKAKERKGKIQLINAASFYNKMTRSLGNKRNEIAPEQIKEIVRMYGDFTENEFCKIYPNEFFGYTRITVERPELNAKGKPVIDKKGKLKADTSLRDFENVPLQEDIEEYFGREVKPHMPDAWIDYSKSKVGYEINFTRYFFTYKSLRTLEEINRDMMEDGRSAFIDQAIIKGVDVGVPLKHTSVEWLGKIPSHWKLKKLKHLVSKVGSGVTPTGGASVYKTSGIPFFRSQNIHFEGLKVEDLAYITEDINQSMQGSKVQKDDILINITGASIGRCVWYDGSLGQANVNQHVCILRPKLEVVAPKFLYYFLRSALGQLQIEMEQTGANREGLTNEGLKNFLVPIPDLKEQIRIVAEIEDSMINLSSTIKKIERKIELLLEYKESLINEMVAGKVKLDAPVEEHLEAAV